MLHEGSDETKEAEGDDNVPNFHDNLAVSMPIRDIENVVFDKITNPTGNLYIFNFACLIFNLLDRKASQKLIFYFFACFLDTTAAITQEFLCNIEINNYPEIGRGKFGIVVRLNDYTALKVIRCEHLDGQNDESMRIFRDAQMELTALNKIAPHRNIVKLFQSLIVREANHTATVLLALELLIGEPILILFTTADEDVPPAISRVTGIMRKDIFSQIHAGLLHIHKHGFVHMDVSPNNVIIDCEGRVILVDFMRICL
jgi:hypothetical protein